MATPDRAELLRNAVAFLSDPNVSFQFTGRLSLVLMKV